MTTDPSSGEIIEVFDWGSEVGMTVDDNNPFETWNLEKDENGIGHAVTGVGYWRNFSPGGGLPVGDWAIVHDNWPLTPINIAVPWQFWTSVTKVKVLPFQVDAPFAHGANRRWQHLFR